MTLDEFVALLSLPPESLVRQRLPKKHLLENGAITSSDKRYINDGIEEMQWVAALRPSSIGVPAFEDSERQYLEIAVLTISYKQDAKVSRIRELIHRAIPYPVVLFGSDGVMSLAELRFSQSEKGLLIIDGEILVADPSIISGNLSIASQPQNNLKTLYQGWCDLLAPLVESSERQKEIARLRKEISKEPQMARRVELNIKIKELLDLEEGSA